MHTQAPTGTHPARPRALEESPPISARSGTAFLPDPSGGQRAPEAPPLWAQLGWREQVAAYPPKPGSLGSSAQEAATTVLEDRPPGALPALFGQACSAPETSTEGPFAQ